MLFDPLEEIMQPLVSVVTEEARRRGLSVDVLEFQDPTRGVVMDLKKSP